MKIAPWDFDTVTVEKKRDRRITSIDGTNSRQLDMKLPFKCLDVDLDW
jgi:hypothetical protein